LMGRKGRGCGVCGRSIRNKKRDLGRHFAEVHWGAGKEG
jgi:hypothetical protein